MDISRHDNALDAAMDSLLAFDTLVVLRSITDLIEKKEKQGERGGNMSTHRIRIPRIIPPYAVYRIAAYECSLVASGKPHKERCVNKWYGTFTEKALCNIVMPYLEAKYMAKGWSYPFLITTYMLEKQAKADVTLSPDRKVGVKDIKYHPRLRSKREAWVATILSPTEYDLTSWVTDPDLVYSYFND